MRLKIHHETHYVYDTAPLYVVQRLHLSPANFDGQRTLSWQINSPGIETGLQYVDGFGNIVHLITAELHSTETTIVAFGEVETLDKAGIVTGLATTAPATVFLRQTPVTIPDEAMQRFAEPLRKMKSPLERLHALMAAIHQTVAYEMGSSHAYTTAAQAFADLRGVCQDHSHIMVGIARLLGMPARYVTGYLVTGIGASSSAAHAWAEVHVPDLGWVGFDAANNQSPTDHYVRIAAGLDAAAVAPVRGLRRGGGRGENMTVEVRVEIAQQ
jgi:transglutaminase-like putative cysteine protease